MRGAKSHFVGDFTDFVHPPFEDLAMGLHTMDIMMLHFYHHCMDACYYKCVNTYLSTILFFVKTYKCSAIT